MMTEDGAAFPLLEIRLRNRIGPAEMERKVGRIVGAADYNAVMTGPVRLLRPQGDTLAVYLPGVLRDVLHDAWATLSDIRMATDNRGLASGTTREQRGDQKRTRTRPVLSAIVGAVDPGPSSSKVGARLPVCRLTAWTGKHLPEWHGLHPVFEAIDRHYAQQVPGRWILQRDAADATHPDWVIGDTVFTTVTVNNTYSTGVHQDKGDLPEGFSTLAVARRGDYRGGHLVLPEYRVAFDMRDGDLLLFDAHEWHGNTNMYCPHQDTPLARPCPQGCERVSLVTYFRTKVANCASAETEYQKALAVAER